MGFLSGAYGKLMAGQLVRQLQHQQTSIQSRLNRVTKQAGEMEKYFNRMERNMKSQMQSQMQYSMYGLMGGMGLMGQTGLFGMSGQGMQMDQYQAYLQNSQYIQQQFAMAQNVWQDQFEMQREAQLEPLHDLEDSLQTELDNIKSRLELAKEQYKAKQDEEKDGAKNMAPDYTGQGG